jgi:SlyX protein
MSEDVETLKRQMLELQSQFAFQEDVVRNLDSALAAQQQEILVLRRQLALLNQRQQEQAVHFDSEFAASAPLDDKPPHY